MTPPLIDSLRGSRSIYEENPLHLAGWVAEARVDYAASRSSTASALEPQWYTHSMSIFFALESEADRSRRERLTRLLRSWRAGDRKEQAETFNYLREAIDRDRSSDRRLFE